MLGSPHTRARRRPAPGTTLAELTIMSKSINRPHILSFCLHFHLFIFMFERETEFCTVLVRQSTNEVLLTVGRSFHPGRRIAIFPRSTIERALFVLKRLCSTQDLICKQVLITLIFILVFPQTIPHTDIGSVNCFHRTC